MEWLCYGDLIQSIVLQHSGDPSTTGFPIARSCATAPVYRFLGNVIFGKCKSIDDQQMLAPLTNH